MAKQTVELGDGPDLGISDNLYEGFSKVNSNTDELYSRVENLESFDSREEFIITMIPNTLIGNITPISVPYDAYIITQVDDGLPPEDSPLWISGIIPTQLTLPGWNTYTYYLYIKFNTMVSQIGTEGVIVTPSDTIVDTAVSDLALSAGDNAPTQIKYLFNTGNDSGTGISQYDLCYAGTNTILSEDITRNSLTTVDQLTPFDADGNAVTLNLWVRITDVAGNTSTEAASNTASITLGTPPAITAFSVADTLLANLPATVTLTAEAGADEALIKIGDSSRPTAGDSGWGAFPATLAFPSGLGVYDVYCWVRDATYPTGISATDSDLGVAITDGGTTTEVIAFAQTSSIVSEEYAPTHTIEVIRSNITGTAVGASVKADSLSAIAGTHFQPLDTTIAFGAGETSVDVDLEVLYSQIQGIDSSGDVTLTLTLSSPTGGAPAVIGTDDTHTVTIRGTRGFHSDGNPDWNVAKGQDIGLITSGALIPSNGQTLDKLSIDASLGGSLYGVNCSGRSSVTVKNCEIRNAGRAGVYSNNSPDLKIINCYIHDNHQDLEDDWGYGVFASGTGTIDIDGLHVLNNHIEQGSGGVRVRGLSNFADTTTILDILIENNWFTDFYRTSNQGEGVFITWCKWGVTSSLIIRNNQSWWTLPSRCEDHINIFRSGGRASTDFQALIENNWMYGQTTDNRSGASLLIGDNARGLNQGHTRVIHNCSNNSGGAGASLMGGGDQEIYYNDFFMPSDSPFVVKGVEPGSSFVGLVVQRAVNTPQGGLDNGAFGYNRGIWYTDFNDGAGPKQNDYYKPSVGADGLPPNHGTYVSGVDTETTVTDWSNNIKMYLTSQNQWGESWDSQPLWVTGRKQILTQPGAGDGIYVAYASYACPEGNGELIFDQGNNTLQFRAYGQSFGAAVSLASAEYGIAGVPNTYWHVYSSDANTYVKVKVTAADLPVADASYVIKVSKFKFGEWVPYAGATGIWSDSDSGTPPTDVTPPTPPVMTGAVAGSGDGELDITWTKGTDANGIASNSIYVNDAFYTSVGDVALATLTGLNTAGTAVSVTVVAYDPSGNASDASEPLVGTPKTASAPASEELLNAEFTANSTEPDETIGWDASNCTPSPITPTNGTEFELVRTAAGNASIWQRVTGLTPASTYKLTVAQHNGVGNGSCKVVVDNTGASRPWTGVVATVMSNPLAGGYVEQAFTGISPSGTGQLDVVLWVNSGTTGDSTWLDYCRLEEE